ncbi:MAG: Rhamnosyltransferase [uncultured Rubrobacteraceae bacterium]|uniref:4,4'-diaponeurosporenoate glycosyltransferase n=1 Tax=uncultured Rubrobacteraceae bacterium TaxID=349277 RepID=A0A6J4QPD8_9ACTN|nr:MAG: Rhamnosyltransferase [uncultured Rubrobacteraceae bacterium]
MTAGATRVSVVIPTLDAGPGFEELLEKIQAQEGDFDLEILVIDSGSTDGTEDLARRYGATVHRISREEFNHGATRNLGISLARGEYVALTVQDAVPLDERWLAAMVENLEEDELVAGVYGRQAPRPNSAALTRVLVNSLATAGLERREQFAGGPERYREMSPAKRRRLAAFDNVSSCLRRSVWEKIPFEKTSFGEDIRWGKRVVEAGYNTVYEPRSAVFHSHERGALYDLRRYYVDQRVLLDLFGLELVPNLRRLLLSIPRSAIHLYRLLRKDEELAAKGTPVLVLLAVKYAVPAQVGAYLGARSAEISRVSPRVFEKLHRFLSKGI